jgi:hypothetical protein
MKILNQEKKSKKFNKHEEMLVNHDYILNGLLNKMEDLKVNSQEIKLLNHKVSGLDKQITNNNQEIYDELDSNSKNVSDHTIILNKNCNKLEKLEKDNNNLTLMLSKLLEDNEFIVKKNNELIEIINNKFIQVESKLEDNESLTKSIEQKYIDLDSKFNINLKKLNLKVETMEISIENNCILSEFNKKNINVINNQHSIVKNQIDTNTKEYDSILEEHFKKIQKNKEIISSCLKNK